MYTQYMYNLATVNPAENGIDDLSKYTSLTRFHFVGVDGAPITHSLSADVPLKKFSSGVGASYFYDQLRITSYNVCYTKLLRLPQHGTAVVNGDTVIYTPAADYLGTDTLEYRICDADGDCDTAQVVIHVKETNYVPIAINDSANVYMSTPVRVITSYSIHYTKLYDASVIFTPANWNTAQTITITGVNDNVDDDNQPYTIVLGAATGTDANYSGANPTDVSVINTDNNTAAIQVSATSLTTTEAGGNATFTIVLGSEPTANVVIPLSSTNTAEASYNFV